MVGEKEVLEEGKKITNFPRTDTRSPIHKFISNKKALDSQAFVRLTDDNLKFPKRRKLYVYPIQKIQSFW